MNAREFLLKASEIDAMKGEERTHFLNPNAVRLRKSLGDVIGLAHLGVHLIELAPGRDSTEYHLHYFEEECIYVLEGEGEVCIDQQVFAIGVGDFIAFPAGSVAHGMNNTSERPLKYLVMGQRLSHDVADYPYKGRRLYRNQGCWDLVDLDTISHPK
ncbi:MAG: cupin domain-containing protein [Shewanella algae]